MRVVFRPILMDVLLAALLVALAVDSAVRSGTGAAGWLASGSNRHRHLGRTTLSGTGAQLLADPRVRAADLGDGVAS